MYRREILINVFRERVFIILSGLLFFLPISVTQAEVVIICNLKECIQYALENRSDARAAKFEVDMAGIGITIEKSKFSTKFNVDTETGYFTGKSTTPFATIANISDEGISQRVGHEDPYYSARLNLDVPLFMEGTIYKKDAPSVKKMEYERLHKIALQETVESEIIYEVTGAFSNVLQQMIAVEINELNVKLKKLTYETLHTKSQEGLVPEMDLISAEIELLNTQKDLDISKNELQLRKKDLSKSLGGPLYTEIEIFDHPWDIPELPDVETLTDVALSNRSELKSMKTLFAVEKENVEFYKKSGYPTANLIGNYTLADNFDRPVNDSWNVFMKVNIPILDGGFNKKNVSLSEIKTDMIQEKLAWLNKEISQEVWSSYYEVKGLKTEFETKEKEIKMQEKRLSLIREKVKENLLPSVMVAEEEIKLEIAKKTNLQLKYKLREALDKLNKALGDMPHALS